MAVETAIATTIVKMVGAIAAVTTTIAKQKAVNERTVTVKIIAQSAASLMTQSETTTAKASINQMSAQIETQIARSAVARAVRTSAVEKIAATTLQSKAKNQPQKRNLSLS